MTDKRNTMLWETIRELPDNKALGLLYFLFGFEESCKHFHDGVETWLEVNPPDVKNSEA